MLNQPPPLPSRRRTPARTAPAPRVAAVATMSDEQEASGFMAFLGEHQSFAATHRGA